MNPYAPHPSSPYGGPPAGAPPPPPGARDDGWTAGDVVSAAWESFQPQWTILVASYALVSFVVQMANIPGALVSAGIAIAHVSPEGLFGLSPRFFQWAVSMPIMFAASSFFQVGLMRLWLQVARGERPQFEVIFSGLDRFLPLMGLSLLMGIAITLGTILLVFPGILLTLGWSMAPFYVVDANLGPVEALEASWASTNGRWGTLFLLFLASIGFTMLGLACCCIGVLAAAPLAMLLFAIAYTRLSGRGASDALGAGIY
jgi:hypothetical protein